MINDYELEFSDNTGAGGKGQLFNPADSASEYGGKLLDMKAAADLGIGEKVHALYKVEGANNNVGTSYDIAIVGDDDGVGGGEVTLITKTVLVANLTLAKGVQHIGVISPAAANKRYYRAKVTGHGAAATTGPMRIWLAPGDDATPANDAYTL